MFRIELKALWCSNSKAILHRRIVTPWFYIRLRPKIFKFEEFKTDFATGLIITPLIIIPPIPMPKGKFREVGMWSAINKKHIKELETLKKGYSETHSYGS